jgi:hypothetical protein
MTVRAQATMLHSYFTQEYFNILNADSTLKNISEWLKLNINSKSIDQDLFLKYYEIYRVAADLFGTENVNVLFYEDLKSRPEKYASDWAEVLNINTETVQAALKSEPKNVTKRTNRGGGVKTDAPTLHQLLSNYANKLGASDSLKSLGKNLLPSGLLQKKLRSENQIRNFTKAEEQMIKNRFHKSNNALFEKIKTDNFIKNSYL